MKLRSSEAFSSGSSASISRTEVATFLATRKRLSLKDVIEYLGCVNF